MQDSSEPFGLAFRLAASADPDLVEIALLSLRVSVAAVLPAGLIGLPLGALLAVARCPGRGALLVAVNALATSSRLSGERQSRA